MAEEEKERAALRREVRSHLGQLGVPLQILAEDLAGEEDGTIDWVAVEPDGRVWVGLVDLEGDDAGLLARGLAQRAWVRARLRDWHKLAPGLPARPDLAPRLLLVAPSFSRVTQVAAREADPDGLRLVRLRWRRGRLGIEIALELPASAGSAAGSAPAGAGLRPALPPVPVASVFRSGLSARDFESDFAASTPLGETR